MNSVVLLFRKGEGEDLSTFHFFEPSKSGGFGGEGFLEVLFLALLKNYSLFGIPF